MDSRHEPPIISTRVHLDWSNPLLIWAVGVVGLLVLAVVLVVAHTF